jgi:phosphatidate cytidylyltransferase
MNLLLRVISALVLLPGVLWVLYTGGYPLSIMTGVIGALCFYEYANLTSSPSLVTGEGLGVRSLGYAYIALGLSSLYFLRQLAGFEWVLLILICTWMNDTFAYFAGRAFGKHKMAPKISEKKTWEGFIGGAVGTIAMPFVLRSFLGNISTADILWVAIPCVVLAPVGDLIESKVKRIYGAKDSGSLLPGHGGFLDRIDALLLTVPWALAYFMLR